MSVKTHPISVRLDQDLHREASVVARLSDTTFQQLVEDGLRSEIERRLQDGKLAATLRTLARRAAEV